MGVVCMYVCMYFGWLSLILLFSLHKQIRGLNPT